MRWTRSLGDKTFADMAAENEKKESTACKEGNHLDYQPSYEDISDVEDLM